MTIQMARATLRELDPTELELVAGGQTSTEQSLMSTFSNNNGIQLNSSWGYTDDGEFYEDSDCNGYYDTVYYNMGYETGWVMSTDGGWHWQRTDKPDYYHGDCEYPVERRD